MSFFHNHNDIIISGASTNMMKSHSPIQHNSFFILRIIHLFLSVVKAEKLKVELDFTYTYVILPP